MSNHTVQTGNGLVKGYPAADPRITVYNGVPFAAPPIRENRWKAPQPCKDWDGVLNASEFAPISIQDTPGLGDNIYTREWHVDPDIAMDEDCLYLNIWTGAKGAGSRLPVLVWFFGGGLQWGYTAEMEFDGERIARRGIVVVTVNYRLNVFGFFAHPELTAKQPVTPTNFGHLDQQAGLQWVIRNIAAFGGDPENITIAGQSAGGGSVMAQMAYPGNQGLFHRVIVMSGMIRSPYVDDTFVSPRTLEDAENNGKRFLDFLGVDSIESARELDALYIRDKYAEYAKQHPRMATVIDGRFCPGDPIRMFMENKHVKVPVMAGNTRGEFLSAIPAESDAAFRQKAEVLLGDRAEDFLRCEEAWEKDEHGHYAPVSGIECTVKTLFEQNEKNGNTQPCYYYRFDTDIPGWDHPGTFHSVDLWFFFETLAKCWRPFVGRHYDLARQMCNYLCNFIRSGDPNGEDADGSDLPRWSPYQKAKPFEMVFTAQGPVCYDRKETAFVRLLMGHLAQKIMR